MRWSAKPVRQWKPWFALLPMRWDDDRMIWLEPIWVRPCGYYIEWCPWEMRPNEAQPSPSSPSIQENG